jgi:hypothetical protein
MTIKDMIIGYAVGVVIVVVTLSLTLLLCVVFK